MILGSISLEYPVEKFSGELALKYCGVKQVISEILRWFSLKPQRIVPDLTLSDNAWNRFVDYAITHELERVQPDILPAYLVFWYMSEVENGGHLQYFTNRRDDPFETTVKALHDMGSASLAGTLETAFSKWKLREINDPESVEEYVSLALGGEFEVLDLTFYNADPNIADILNANIPSRFVVADQIDNS